MMKTTMTLATNLHISPFELFSQDCDEVIMLINFYILLGQDKSIANATEKKQIPKSQNKKEQRIRVNDYTATGGWF